MLNFYDFIQVFVFTTNHHLNEKYFQSGCSVDLFLRRIILIFSHIIGMNYIIFHNYIIYSFIRL